MNDELKPCERCGGKMIYKERQVPQYITDMHFKPFFKACIYCETCGYGLYDGHETEQEAIAAWNKRA